MRGRALLVTVFFFWRGRRGLFSPPSGSPLSSRRAAVGLGLGVGGVAGVLDRSQPFFFAFWGFGRGGWCGEMAHPPRRGDAPAAAVVGREGGSQLPDARPGSVTAWRGLRGLNYPAFHPAGCPSCKLSRTATADRGPLHAPDSRKRHCHPGVSAHETKKFLRDNPRILASPPYHWRCHVITR